MRKKIGFYFTWKRGFQVFCRKIMARLEKKLDKELKPGAKIISYGFSFPNWQYLKKEQATFLYEKK